MHRIIENLDGLGINLHHPSLQTQSINKLFSRFLIERKKEFTITRAWQNNTLMKNTTKKNSKLV